MDKQYLNKFKNKFTEFINFLLIDDIIDKLPKKLQEDIKLTFKGINTINYIKLSYIYFTTTKDLKEDILRHQNKIFLTKKQLFPSIDISEIYKITKETPYVNQLWDYLAELKILSDIIINALIKENDKKKTEQEQLYDMETLSKMSENEINEKLKNFSIKGADKITVSNIISKQKIEDEYKESSLLGFVKNLDVENASLNDVLLGLINKVDLNDELNKLDDNTIKEITGVVNDFFGNDNGGMDNMVKDIAETLKHTDLKTGKLEDKLQDIASNMTDKIIKSNNEDDIKNLAGKAKDIMKDYDSNKDMMTNVETILKSKFGKDFNGMGFNKSDVEQMLKSYGLGNISGANSRKIKRMANKSISQNVTNKSHTPSSVNNRQLALKNKYNKNKKIKEDNKNNQNNQNNPKQNKINNQKTKN